MAKDPAFLFYYQDFMYGTRRFTAEQRGIYIELMCEQADSETGSIPEEHMNNICKTYDKDILKIVHSKFKKDENGYYNATLREHLNKRRAYVESRRNNRKSPNIKKDMNNICKTYDSHMENENEIKDKDEIKDKEGFAVDECFEEIWALYPNKIGRKQAYKHFKASVRSDKDFENIHIALKNYIKSDRVGGGFIQNGSTWFNNWQDWVYPTQSMLTGKNGYSKTRSAASEFVEEMTNAKF